MKIIKTETKEVPTVTAAIINFKQRKPARLSRHCNLCDEEFYPRSKYERFCEKCRAESELLHFSEWLSA